VIAAGGCQSTAIAVEQSGRFPYLLGFVGTVAAAGVAYSQW
jgi:hypothetical protein